MQANFDRVYSMRSGEAVYLGFRAHSGWAAMIAAADGPDGPRVLHRRRIELADASMPVQPYHAAEPMPYSKAEAFIARCLTTSCKLARQELEAAIARLAPRRVRAACVLDSSARPLPDLRSVLAAHPLIHTAEGEMYREAIRTACADLGIAVVRVRERDVWADAPAEAIARIGKELGPPWTQDQKLATAAALAAARRVRGTAA
jgi:hypothetical protein